MKLSKAELVIWDNYFAHAIALCANRTGMTYPNGDSFARSACEIADAMMAERKRRQGSGEAV